MKRKSPFVSFKEIFEREKRSFAMGLEAIFVKFVIYYIIPFIIVYEEAKNRLQNFALSNCFSEPRN